MDEENKKIKENKSIIPIIIIVLLVAFIVAGTIICINSFSKGNNTENSNQNENTIPILNGNAIINKGTGINLR